MNNYTKTMWVDHLVENPDRYNIIYNPDNSITLSPREGEVFQEGTPINAIHLNQLEEGVYQALTGEILLGEFQGESRKLVLKKGIEGAMPTLAEGELGYATDTRKLFMGTSTGNASVMPEIDVSGAVEEVVDRRVNHVKNKSLSQIILEEIQGIKDFFVTKVNERLNNVTDKSLNQVINETILAARDALYAQVEACKNDLVNNMSWIKDVINGHITAEANSIRNYIVSGTSPCVKSVQRGVLSFNYNSGDTLYINISSINPLKTVVTLEGVSGVMAGDLGISLPFIQSLTTNELTICRIDRVHQFQSVFSWQVIEYY